MSHSRSAGSTSSARSLDGLAEAARAGDRIALEQLMHRAESRLIRMALAFGVSPDDAPDLVQEVLLNAWRRLHDFDSSKGSFLAWVASGLHGRATNLRRGSGRRQSFLDRFRNQVEGKTNLPHGALDARMTLVKMLQGLTARQREVIGLYELGGFSGRETATLLGISEASVRSIARDARALLKRAATGPSETRADGESRSEPGGQLSSVSTSGKRCGETARERMAS